jgi:hypothetical protein
LYHQKIHPIKRILRSGGDFGRRARSIIVVIADVSAVSAVTDNMDPIHADVDQPLMIYFYPGKPIE